MSRLAAGVHVWTRRVVAGAALGRLEPALDEGERRRAQRFVRESDRCSYVTAHWLLRQALSWATPSVESSAWRFRRTRYGKPELAAGWPRLRFSLSHSCGYVAVALTDGADCGVDVESTRRVAGLSRLAESVLSPRELALFLAAGDDDDRRRQFFRCWTLKEAYAKAVGLGLRLPFDQLDFGSGHPVELSDGTSGYPRPARDWSFEHWTRDGSSFAVAFRTTADAAPARVIRDTDALVAQWLK